MKIFSIFLILISTVVLADAPVVEFKREVSIQEIISVFESLKERPALPLKIHYFKEIEWPKMSDKELEEAVKSDMASIENNYKVTQQILTESNRLETLKDLRASLPFSNYQILECHEMVANGKYRRDFTYLDNLVKTNSNQFSTLARSVDRIYCSVMEPLPGQPTYFEINRHARSASITFQGENERFRFAKDGSWRALAVEYDAILPMLLMLTDWSSWTGIRDEFDLPRKLKLDQEKIAQSLNGNDDTIRIEAYDTVFNGVPALRLIFRAGMPPSNPAQQAVQFLKKAVGDKSKLFFTNEIILNRTNYHQWFQVRLFNPIENLDYLSTRENFDDQNVPRRWTVRQTGPNVPKGQMTVTLHIKDYEFNSKMDLAEVFGFYGYTNYTVWDVDKNVVLQLAPGVSPPSTRETGIRRNYIIVILFVTLAVGPLIFLGKHFRRQGSKPSLN
jgi:hypothetical protein